MGMYTLQILSSSTTCRQSCRCRRELFALSRDKNPPHKNVENTSRELQVRVVDVTPGIFVGDQAVDDILRVGDTSNNRAHSQFVL